ncbi:MAG: hypothetical protein ACTH2U_01340 [Brevibacterium sp.]
MVPGRWGSLGGFLLVTTGIGALSSALWALTVILTQEPGTWLGSLSWTPIFAFAGALLGLLLGVPAFAVVRLVLPHLTGRAGSLLFFFGLGAASVLVSLGVMALLFGGNIPMVYTVSNGEFEPSVFIVVPIAGILTALASFRIAVPADDGVSDDGLMGEGFGDDERGRRTAHPNHRTDEGRPG